MRIDDPGAGTPDALETADTLSGEATIVIDGQDRIELDSDFVLAGDYARAGADLILTDASGESVVLAGYFSAAEPPVLVTPEGAAISPDWAGDLARFNTPQAFAQAGEVAAQQIGVVSDAQGTVTVVRADGTQVTLQEGDPVFLDDVIETAPGGGANLILADDTEFTIGGEASLVLDEFVYDPATGDGSLSLAVAKGVFSFVSGAVATTGTDAMTVQTPVGTIGIRGTTGAGGVGPDGQVDFALLPDSDGTVGQIVFTNAAGSVVINTPLTGFSASGIDAAIQQRTFGSIQELGQVLGADFQTLSTLSTRASQSFERADDPSDPGQDAEGDGEDASEEDTEAQGEEGAAEEEGAQEAAEDSVDGGIGGLGQTGGLGGLGGINRDGEQQIELGDQDVDRAREEDTAAEEELEIAVEGAGEEVGVTSEEEVRDDAGDDDADTEDDTDGNEGVVGGVNGTDGNDILTGTAGADVINGGAGQDTLDFSSATEPVYIASALQSAFDSGFSIDDVVIEPGLINEEFDEGMLAEPTVLGNADEVLDDPVRVFATGADTDTDVLNGIEVIKTGQGNDFVAIEGLRVTVYGAEGDDEIEAFDGQTLYGGAGADSFEGTGFASGEGEGEGEGEGGEELPGGLSPSDRETYVMYGDDGQAGRTGAAGDNDTFEYLDSHAVAYGEGGNDFFSDSDGGTAYGGAGDDQFENFSGGSLYGDAGDDVFKDVSNVEAYGGVGKDQMTVYGDYGGGGGDVTFFGDDGDDTFYVADDSSYVTIYGGNEDDHVFIGDGVSNVEAFGGDGDDTLSFENALADVTVDAASGDADIGGASVFDTFTGFEVFVGSDYNDTISGSTRAETMFGGQGADTLFGKDGDDVLFFDLSDAQIDGGTGDDIAVVLTDSGEAPTTFDLDGGVLKNVDVVGFETDAAASVTFALDSGADILATSGSDSLFIIDDGGGDGDAVSLGGGFADEESTTVMTAPGDTTARTFAIYTDDSNTVYVETSIDVY